MLFHYYLVTTPTPLIPLFFSVVTSNNKLLLHGQLSPLGLGGADQSSKGSRKEALKPQPVDHSDLPSPDSASEYTDYGLSHFLLPLLQIERLLIFNYLFSQLIFDHQKFTIILLVVFQAILSCFPYL
jgi:hypothetical protein